jgi:tellurite resistance protein
VLTGARGGPGFIARLAPQDEENGMSTNPSLLKEAGPAVAEAREDPRAPVEPQGRLRHFPVTLMAVVMGLSGLAIALQKAHHFLGWPKLAFEVALLLSSAAFVAISTLFAVKAWRHPEMVAREFNHPIKFNFFAAISISLFLQSIAYYAYLPLLGVALWLPGMVLHVPLTLHAISVWIDRKFETAQLNPAWFIPIVGNIIIPVVGVDLVPKEISLYFFSIGVFFWIVLSAALFHRLILGPPLQEKFLPTLFILIAPPAVGFIAYLRIGASFDLFAGFLLSLSLFFALLMLFMIKRFLKMQFFVSWWAMTFPLEALAISMTLAAGVTGSAAYRQLATAVLFVATAAVLVVSLQTVRHVLRREVCVED